MDLSLDILGGKVDILMQRIAEILNGIPQLVIVTLLGLILPPRQVLHRLSSL